MNQNVNPDIEQLCTNVANGFKNMLEAVWRFSEMYRNRQSEINLALRNAADSIETLLSNLPQIVGVLSAELSKQGDAVDKLIKTQFVSLEWLEGDFVAEILSAGDADQINRVLEERFCNEDNSSVTEIADKCYKHKLMAKYKYIFCQSLNAFKDANSCDLAIMGLCAVIDGLLSDISSDTGTQMQNRMTTISKGIEKRIIKECNFLERGTIAYMISLRSVCEVISGPFSSFFDFKGEEPDIINRHWIMHGRTTRAKTRLDFLKILRMLYGLLLLSELVPEKDAAA